ncbi:hypothetical protein B4133_1559 [Bacillus altitudinis]|nr:hypothetical protein B4133_1559 [Bacillus altitudinis]PYH27123.1 hypothetical protein US8_01904 [Bacillus altitudinis]
MGRTLRERTKWKRAVYFLKEQQNRTWLFFSQLSLFRNKNQSFDMVDFL